MKDFVHLHLHSEYSLLDGACRVTDIPKMAKALGQKAVAITDHGVMYGAVAFYNACKKEGIKPIIGCEVYTSYGSRFEKKRTPDYFNSHLTLLVKNETGYKNLIKMVSLAFTEGFYVKPRVDDELLSAYSEGLICLSGCLSGHICKALLKGDEEEAYSYASRLLSYFGKDNFFIEIQDNGVPEQKQINATLGKIAQKLGVGLVATGDVHYLKKSDAEMQAVLTCIQMGTRISDGRPLGFEKDEFYMRSGDEMEKLFSDYEGAIDNTVKIAEECNFDFVFGKNHLPSYTPPEGYTPAKYLEKLASEGLEDKIKSGAITFDSEYTKIDYVMRYKYELMIIEKMGYSEYYLIVWDFVNSAKKNSIAVGPGRGSGAGSLVAYLIGITDVDSIKNKLLFERFLNPERVSMPDFDIDFRDDMREDAIRYVTEKYGKDRVSQIITFGTMAAKMAIRDVGRALGMEYSEVDRVAKMIPQKPGSTIEMAMEGELGQIYAEDRRIRRLIDIARELEGMPRHASVHAAGVLITENSLDSYVPLATSGDSVVAQFDMDTIASLGLLKFDFLAVRYLTVVANAEKEIRINNPDFDIEKIPDNDEKTYSMISEGDTLGLFQLESGGMRRMLSMMKPKNMSDIILAISIYRPGPMDSIPAYLENRRDPSKINYKIDCLRDILDETYGVIVYQEQVMQICRKVANFSYGKADVVRRAMSKKKADAMEKERADFIKGAKANFIDEDVATELFDEMAGFASYAFNKSHAAAYAVTSYRTAYLKANYPAEYFAALLSAFGENPAYMADAKKRGIRTLPPDVNKSGAGFVKDGKDIRYGFLGIKGIGRALADNIAAEREKAPFESFTDFTDRMAARDINRQQLTALASVGAFDSFGVSRAKTVASCERALALSEDKDKRARSGQIDIFAMLGDDENASIKFEYENAEDYTQRQIMNLEKEYMGVFISGSLLDEYSDHEKDIAHTDICEIASYDQSTEGSSFEAQEKINEKKQYTFVGIVSRIIRKNTKNGSVMAFVTLEDRGGEIEIIIFPKLLDSKGILLAPDAAYSFTGNISLKEDEAPKMLASDFEILKTNAVYQKEKRLAALKAVDMSHSRSYYSNEGKEQKAAAYQNVAQNVQTKTAYSKLYLKIPSLSSKEYKRANAIVSIFSEEGNADVIFFDNSCEKYVQSGIKTDASDFVINELAQILGKDNVKPR